MSSGEGGSGGARDPIVAVDPSKLLCLVSPSLQGPEQLGDYNHRRNAAGQADKRGLRAGLRG